MADQPIPAAPPMLTGEDALSRILLFARNEAQNEEIAIVDEAERYVAALRAECAARLDLLESAWGVIANAAEGDWSQEHPRWQEAAARWRDKYHETLNRRAPGDGTQVSREKSSENETGRDTENDTL